MSKQDDALESRSLSRKSRHYLGSKLFCVGSLSNLKEVRFAEFWWCLAKTSLIVQVTAEGTERTEVLKDSKDQ